MIHFLSERFPDLDPLEFMNTMARKVHRLNSDPSYMTASRRAPQGQGRTLLHDAAASGFVEACEAFVYEFGIDVNSRSACGSTPLHSAAFWGKVWRVYVCVCRRRMLRRRRS